MVWKRTTFATCLALVILIGAIGLLGPARARGGDVQEAAVTSARRFEDQGDGHANSFRMNAGTTGNIAFCAQGYLVTPQVGQKLTRYGGLSIPELDYVLYHGYDGEVVTSLAGLTAEKSELATAVAVWLAIAEQRADLLTFQGNHESYHGNKLFRERWESQSDQQVKQAAWSLYQEGLAYRDAGGGGVEAGCATLWLNGARRGSGGSADFQALVTVSKRVKVTFEKSSDEPARTAGNPNYPLSGAHYDIFKRSDGQKIGSFATDDDGSAAVELAPGTAYYVVETDAPTGFQRDPQRIAFETGPTPSTVKLADTPGTVTLQIGKRDAATKGGAQRGATLGGAEFRITSLSTADWEATGSTDAHGALTIPGVPLGSFQVVETKAPTGYRIDPAVHTYTVGPDELTETGTVELVPEEDYLEFPIAFDLEVAKFLNKTGESESGLEPAGSGISFDIVSKSTNKPVGRIVTGEDGCASTAGLWFGEGERVPGISGALPFDEKGYLVKEVPETVPPGFTVSDEWEVTPDQMVDGATLRYIVNNTVITSRLQIIKTDIETERTIPLAGFSFQLLDEDKRPITQESWYPRHIALDTFTTDETGTVALPERLKAGTYYISEIHAAAPYLINDQETRFEITEGGSGAIAVVRVGDAPAKGSAELVKTCSEDGKPLSGAEYDVIAQSDISAPDGALIASAGQAVAHVETDHDGVARVSDLPLGTGTATYAFVETKPPSGHARNVDPLPFTLTYQDDRTPTVHARVETSDVPTRIEVGKRVMGTDKPLSGASFLLWNQNDEVALEPERGFGAVALRMRTAADNNVPIHLEPLLDNATVILETAEDLQVTAKGADGASIPLTPETSLEPGTYTFQILRGADVEEPPSLTDVPLAAGEAYRLSISPGIFGEQVGIETGDGSADSFELTWDEKRSAFTSTQLPAGGYSVVVDGNRRGEIHVSTGSTSFAWVEEEDVASVPILLKPGVGETVGTSDENGRIIFDHVDRGRHRLAEITAPAGYLTEGLVHEINVDEDGNVDGSAEHLIQVEDDFTKIEISKRDITTEEEIEGAELTVEDAAGGVVASWVSGRTPHRIEALPPGDYTLTEQLTPRSHDLATSVRFTVLESGDVQRVAMYDEPIEIQGEIDKRQEIADPVNPDTEAMSPDERGIGVSVSDQGYFDYSIDFRNTSSTWTDEFTVDDELVAVGDGLARLRAVTTPQGAKDFDGLMNIWYRTIRDNGTADEGSQANATREDGHVNPWLDHEEVIRTLGDDARSVDYRGWHLWAANINTTRSTTLTVDGLKLQEDEEIVAVRFEYGRVERGFTTRPDGWDRDNLKNPADNVPDVLPTHTRLEQPAEADGASFAPAIIHMRVTDSYTEGTPLENRAEVHLMRNGGGPGLEDRDDDRVIQHPVSTVRPLPQTGITSPLPALIATAATTSCISGYLLWNHMKRRGTGHLRAPRRRPVPPWRTYGVRGDTRRR